MRLTVLLLSLISFSHGMYTPTKNGAGAFNGPTNKELNLMFSEGPSVFHLVDCLDEEKAKTFSIQNRLEQLEKEALTAFTHAQQTPDAKIKEQKILEIGNLWTKLIGYWKRQVTQTTGTLYCYQKAHALFVEHAALLDIALLEENPL